MTFTLSLPGQNARTPPRERLSAADREALRAFAGDRGWSLACHAGYDGEDTAVLLPPGGGALTYALHREAGRVVVAACTEERYDVLGTAPSVARALDAIPVTSPLASSPGT